MAEKKIPVPAGMTRLIQEWFTKTIPSGSERPVSLNLHKTK
jgi:hypothetical protein